MMLAAIRTIIVTTDELKRFEALERANEDLRHRVSNLEAANKAMNDRVIAALNRQTKTVE